jgi:hypothetical protein
MFYGGIYLNIVLGVFNLIPVPPLDGSHVLASICLIDWGKLQANWFLWNFHRDIFDEGSDFFKHFLFHCESDRFSN